MFFDCPSLVIVVILENYWRRSLIDCWRWGTPRHVKPVSFRGIVAQLVCTLSLVTIRRLNEQGQPFQVGRAALASPEAPVHLAAIQAAVRVASKGRYSTKERHFGSSARALGAGCSPRSGSTIVLPEM